MAIKIGNNNKIKKFTTIDNSNSSLASGKKESFANRHPVLISIGCSIIASVIMMFAFWDTISEFIRAS